MAIYYGCPDKDYPVGGIRAIYRHVDILNRNGLEAYVLHHCFPFRCTWFENATRVAHEVRYATVNRSLPARLRRQALRIAGRPPRIDPDPAIELDGGDVLVIPEVMPGMSKTSPGIPKVIFNQNAYLTLAPYPLDVDDSELAYTNPDVVGAIVVSEDSRKYVATLFPQLRVRRVHYAIDPDLFAFTRHKKRQLAFMRRKNARDIQQVLVRLRLTGRLEGWDFVEIAGRSEAEAAATLRESAIFLSAGHPEGFGLPAAEAMRSGCVVIGYHGYGGREFMTDDCAFPIDVGDVVAFADKVADVIEQLEAAPDAFSAQVEAASHFIAQTYSPAREEGDLLEIWREFAPGAR